MHCPRDIDPSSLSKFINIKILREKKIPAKSYCSVVRVILTHYRTLRGGPFQVHLIHNDNSQVYKCCFDRGKKCTLKP